MMKQEKVVAFCYNCDIGQHWTLMYLLNIYICIYLSILQGSTSPSVMRMAITNQVSAMEAWGSAGVWTDMAMRCQDPEQMVQRNVVS